MARIEGIKKGGSLLARIAFLLCRRRFGRVVTPLRIYALHSRIMGGYLRMELAQDRARRVPAGVKALAMVRVATRIGCPF